MFFFNLMLLLRVRKKMQHAKHTVTSFATTQRLTRIFSEEADQEAPSEMSTSVNEDEMMEKAVAMSLQEQ